MITRRAATDGPGFFPIWAKTCRSDPEKFHALPYHLIDVGASALALWDRLPSRSKILAIDCFEDEGHASRVCSFLAAAHDIGKANGFFQKKSREQAARLERLGITLPALDEERSHGQATGAFLKPWLAERWQWDNFYAECVARAVGGHHGKFFEDCEQSRLLLQEGPWCHIGPTLLDAIADALQVERTGEPEPLNPFLGWLAGFVCVADWLGSQESMTVWEMHERDLHEYFKEARRRAERLLDKLHWHAPSTGPTLSLAALVPPGRSANALQTAASEIADDFSLAIVEAPTGEGKTEAAFALTEPGRSRGAGAYFALPTMATANGLYERVRNYLQRGAGGTDVDARLLHSQAWLFRDPAGTVSNPGKEGEDQEARVQDWFAGAKRGLLAPYGVGTIDQALIAALRAKHGFVRLFGLAGKTVVIDEVHAYDVYMADLIDVLLGWLRALGCQVVMLSATLPKARREALLRAWGCDGGLPESTYPCITWVDDAGHLKARSFDVQSRKPLTFQPLRATEEEPWMQGANRILELVKENGGLGALVMNTIRDAQNAYSYLKSQDLDGIELDLFHARFTAHDRDSIEKHVLECFGKEGARTAPRILIATQVVEQSLDLDFDHMVSALAPIDLLIQRAGRLHRHRRRKDGLLLEGDGSDERPHPVLEVIVPAFDDDAVPEIDDPVYSKAILLRTLHLIQDVLCIAKPEDVANAIETVYSEAGRNEVLATWQKKLEEFEVQTAKKDQKHHASARRATIGRVDDPDNLIVEAFIDLDENDERQGSQLSAKTRLEDRPSITLALLKNDQTTIHGCSTENLRASLFACVRCSPPFPLWEALLKIEPMPKWQGKSPLSYARPLVLHEGRTQVGEYELTYSAERGLDWRKNANI